MQIQFAFFCFVLFSKTAGGTELLVNLLKMESLQVWQNINKSQTFLEKLRKLLSSTL